MALSSRLFKASVFTSAALLVTFVIASCSSNSSTPTNTSFSGGSAGTAGTAGLDGGGGKGGTGTSTGGVGGSTSGSGGTSSGPCPGPATLDPTTFPPCTLCDNAHCVPTSTVQATAPNFVDQLQDCPDGTSKCVPDEMIATVGKFLFKTCTSLLNAEGRCVPICVKQVLAQKDRLPQDVCQTDERCAPCYDPTNGQPTGACNAGCDPGPVNTTPVLFAKCCKPSGATEPLGSCVPKTLVPASLQSALSQDTCTDPTTLCAPDSFIGTSGTGPVKCKSLEVLPGQYAEGRCVPACVPQVQQQANQLPQDVCQAGEKCAPCYNPIDGSVTGSCTAVATDQPTQPKLQFTQCCKDTTTGTTHGLCVPKSIVPAANQSLPAQECPTTTGDPYLCAPIEKVNNLNYKFPTCDTGLFGPGACIFACFAGANGPILQPGTCTGGTVCAPCTNPLDGTQTGACS